MFGGLLLFFWRSLEIVTLIPTLGMLVRSKDLLHHATHQKRPY
jgi:hypothetical protein